MKMDFILPLSGTLLFGGGIFKIVQSFTYSHYQKLANMPNLSLAHDGTDGYFTGRITADTLQPFQTDMGMIIDLVLVQRKQVMMYEDKVRSVVNGDIDQSANRTTTSIVPFSKLVSDTGIQFISNPFIINGLNRYMLGQDMLKFMPMEKISSVFELPNQGVNVSIDNYGKKNDGTISRKNIGLRIDTLGIKNNAVFTYYGKLNNGIINRSSNSNITKTSHEVNVLNAENDYIITKIISNTLLSLGIFGLSVAFGMSINSNRVNE